MRTGFYQTNSWFCLNLIANNYFDTDFFDCLIDCIFFVKSFGNFFDLEIVFDS